MARRLRVQFAGGIYHVTFRGNGRQRIFEGDHDRLRLKRRLGEAVEDFGVRLFLYCFMSNHAHLLVETPEGNLSGFMSSLLTGYTVYFNRRHNRVGHLMQGRFGSQVVEGDDYLLKMSRYIHLNPVQVSAWRTRSLNDRVRRLRAYRWSSYPAYAGLDEKPEWLDCDPLWAMTPGRGARNERYRSFVEEGLHKPDTSFAEELHACSLAIGSEAFRIQALKAHERQASALRREDVSFRHTRTRENSEAVLRAVAEGLRLPLAELQRKRRDGLPRAIAALALLRRCGLTQREAAGRLSIGSGSAVGSLVRMLRLRMDREPTLARAVDGLTARSLNSQLQG